MGLKDVLFGHPPNSCGHVQAIIIILIIIRRFSGKSGILGGADSKRSLRQKCTLVARSCSKQRRVDSLQPPTLQGDPRCSCWFVRLARYGFIHETAIKQRCLRHGIICVVQRRRATRRCTGWFAWFAWYGFIHEMTKSRSSNGVSNMASIPCLVQYWISAVHP